MNSDSEALSTHLHVILDSLHSRMASQSGGSGISEEVTSFLAAFSELPRHVGYKYVPVEARARIKQLSGHIEPEGIQLFLYICLLTAVRSTLASAAFTRLPERVMQHQLRQFKRMGDEPDKILAVCSLDRDLFLKDFGLATLRLYAAAAQLIDYRAGIGRVMLMKGGLTDLPRRLAIFARIGGFKPFFEIHTHDFYLDEFTVEGWNECYRCCAELYEVHPEVLGMYGGSWFYDPALSAISPRLAYLREVPEGGGASLLFDSTSAQSTALATATSPTRKALYDQGAYSPASYALIWPRARQIAWYRSDMETVGTAAKGIA